MELIDVILSKGNLNRAYKKVVANKGASGVDGVTVEELGDYIRKNKDAIVTSIRNRTYMPKPVRRVYIPKDNGKQRPLGIPTALDRTIQQAIAQPISDIYEEIFSEYSYGFRPGKSCHDAIRQALCYLNSGYEWVVDIDIEQFFDRVNHDKLIQILREQVNDSTTLNLIRKYLKAGVMEKGLEKATTTGVPQGGPLSVVCSNVYLDKLDKELEQRGLRFTRYADDVLIFTKEIDDFTISMDGAKWTQNYSRPLKSGGESFDIVEKWLKRTLDIFPNLRVRMTFNHKTVGTFFENIKYLGGIGVKYIVPARDFYDCKFGEKEFTILKRQLEKSKEYIASENKELHISLLEKFPFKKMGKCSGGIDSFHIDPEGVLYPCALSVGETDFAIGNVLSGIDKKNRDRLLTYSDKFNEACVGCDLYDFCEQTRCKIVNKLLTGEFCTPSPIVCAENHLLLELN